MDYGMLNGVRYEIEYLNRNAVIVGTGAAGYNAADTLYKNGCTNISIVTENVKTGTSRNTGSDKQTYYKLSLSGDTPDSVFQLAEVLFSGGCVDGDLALAEAAMSAQCFLKLVELGVPFPRNKYGEYIGYKTDHDPSKRATSIGPYTSKIMTECLEASVNTKNIQILNNLQVIRLLAKNNEIFGLLCLDVNNSKTVKFVAINCNNIIYATGGPAGIYRDSVYPNGHFGASGVAFQAGVKGKNLTEWQYGLASIKPRWNVSGTYMQVLPKFVSTDMDGNNPKEFLFEFFENKGDMLTKIFLKGYQWPFDVRKIDGGSSIIDILVYVENIIKGRRIFLDFRENPQNEKIDFKTLSNEAFKYLDKAEACFGTPFERLQHMNEPAVSFYQDKGVNLNKDMLEIALCAQHNNGGLDVDDWWQTNLKGFFAAGEVSGTHGVYRPGGSALNAGQVGSARAALFVAEKSKNMDLRSQEEFLKSVNHMIAESIQFGLSTVKNQKSTLENLWQEATSSMSKYGAAIRNSRTIEEYIQILKLKIEQFVEEVSIDSTKNLKNVYRLYDIYISQYVYLNAILNYLEKGGKSRGSSLYYDNTGSLPYEQLDEMFRYQLDDGQLSNYVQEVMLEGTEVKFNWRPVREIPRQDEFFENVWRGYRENRNIY